MIQIKIPFNITDEFIEDVMTTALEGGCNYWIEDVRNTNPNPKSEYFSTSLAEGDTLIITDSETCEEHAIDKYSFVEGYKRYIERRVKLGLDFYTDPCDIDSGEADDILQLAVFKEIIFG